MYFECFLTLLGSKTPRGKEGSYMGKRKEITRNVYYECFLNFLSIKRIKRMKSTESKTTLPKTCISRVFDIVRYEKAKMHAKPPISGKKNRHHQKRVFSVFLSVLVTNTLKSMEITLYKNTKQRYVHVF